MSYLFCDCQLRHYILIGFCLLLVLGGVASLAKGEYEARKLRQMGSGEINARLGNIKAIANDNKSAVEKIRKGLVKVQTTNAEQSLQLSYLKGGLLLALGAIITLIVEVMSGIIRQKMGLSDEQ